jgi:hypothetical protein
MIPSQSALACVKCATEFFSRSSSSLWTIFSSVEQSSCRHTRMSITPGILLIKGLEGDSRRDWCWACHAMDRAKLNDGSEQTLHGHHEPSVPPVVGPWPSRGRGSHPNLVHNLSSTPGQHSLCSRNDPNLIGIYMRREDLISTYSSIRACSNITERVDSCEIRCMHERLLR